MKQVSYDPSVFFNIETVDEAVRVILTPEDGLTSEQRWKNEAAFLMQKIDPHVHQCDNIVDYGCGIGRMAKPLIYKWRCNVVGVDISPNMRALAASCVESDDFFALSPEMFSAFFNRPRFDGALAIWTLQHVLELGKEIRRIRNALKPDGFLFVLNNHQRALPSNAGPWLDDGKDVDAEILASGFDCIERGQLEGADVASEWLAKQTFWAVYRKT